MLNRKRDNKKANHKILPKDEEIKEEKKIENIKQNFHHFFYINWENSVFSKREGIIVKEKWA